MFLKSFQTDKENPWQHKSKILELENNNMLDELKKLNNIDQVGNVSEDSRLEHGSNIKKSFSNDSSPNMDIRVKEGYVKYNFKIQ